MNLLTHGVEVAALVYDQKEVEPGSVGSAQPGSSRNPRSTRRISL